MVGHLDGQPLDGQDPRGCDLTAIDQFEAAELPFRPDADREATDVQDKPGGQDHSRPPGIKSYQSRFTTRSARPFKATTSGTRSLNRTARMQSSPLCGRSFDQSSQV